MPAAPSVSAARAPAASRQVFGSVLCRLIVPLWVLAGAAFKLYERNPANLPSVIRDLSRSSGLENLDTLLRVLIGLELFAVAVMFLMPRFARAMAVFMLSCFCAILIGEIATGAATCGCFGSLPLKPWTMLIIDGTMLLLVVLFPTGRRAVTGSERGGWLIAAITLLALSLGVALIVPNPAAKNQTPIAINDNGGVIEHASQPAQPSQPPVNATQTEQQPATQGAVTLPSNPPAQPALSNIPPTVNPNPKPLPPNWYTQKMDEWIGKPWRELDIFQLMPTWPRDMDKGPRYIVFYSRTCDHCRTMLEIELVDPLDGLTTLVEVPAARDVMTDPNAWEMPMTVETILGAELLQLPLGPSWIITTPMVIKVVDGKVVCATEGGDHKKCLGLP